jgi:hypothetical protein
LKAPAFKAWSRARLKWTRTYGVEKGSVLNALLKAVFQPFELKGIARFRWDGIREVPVEEYTGFASRSKSTVVEDQAIQLEPIKG